MESAELQVTPERSVTTRTVKDEASTRGVLAALGGAFVAFGIMLGLLGGLSVSPGVSQTLLTSCFTFVAGALLSFAGIQRRGLVGLQPDPMRIAVSLAGLSLGMVLGLPCGLYSRCNVHAQSFFIGENVKHSSCSATQTETQIGAATSESEANRAPKPSPGSPNIGIQSRAMPSACHDAIINLNIAVGEPQRSEQDLRAQLRTLLDACGLIQR